MKISTAVVVVTGASSGIGRATAQLLARRGATVIAASRRRAALEALAAEAGDARGVIVPAPTDVTDPEQVERLAQDAAERFGRIDGWVNSAAVGLFGRLDEVPLDDFRRVLDVNIMGCVHGARAVLPVFAEQKRGVLVNVASIVGVVPQPYTSAYSLSKAAIRSLSTSIRSELMLRGLGKVHVSTVLPPTIDTPFFAHAANYTGRAARAMPPVYPPTLVAEAIVGQLEKPRREVVVGRIGRALVKQHAKHPGAVEKQMAVQVEGSHLSPLRESAPTSGNLYRPLGGAGSVDGGWAGAPKTRARTVLGVGALAGAGYLVVRGLRR